MTTHRWLIPSFLVGTAFYAMGDTVPAGAEIAVRLDQAMSITKLDRGRIYRARIARDVPARDGDVAIRAGSPVELIVRQTGPNRLALDLESVTVNRHRYVLDTTGPQFRTHEYENGNGLVGIIGAITGAEVQGERINVPPNTMLSFRLQAPLHVADWDDPGYDRDGAHYHRDRDWYR